MYHTVQITKVNILYFSSASILVFFYFVPLCLNNNMALLHFIHANVEVSWSKTSWFEIWNFPLFSPCVSSSCSTLKFRDWFETGFSEHIFLIAMLTSPVLFVQLYFLVSYIHNFSWAEIHLVEGSQLRCNWV